QAEDGIRDFHVTGVQTCALPIFEAVVQQLAEFRPTRIAIEVAARRQDGLDKRYNDYRNGQYELARDEAEQIGLRLAAMLGHERRSEERRVGKARITRRWTSHNKQ